MSMIFIFISPPHRVPRGLLGPAAMAACGHGQHQRHHGGHHGHYVPATVHQRKNSENSKKAWIFDKKNPFQAQIGETCALLSRVKMI